MKGILISLWCFLTVLGLAPFCSWAEVPVPPLTGPVVDETGTLSSTEKQALEAYLRQFEQEKGSQIAVLIVPTTAPETIEQYGIRVGEAWKLGRKGIDDGAILLIAKDDRKIRIEVGYGLEGALPDVIAKRIVAEIITPHFKKGDFFAGIDAGAHAIVQVVQGEPLPAPSQTSGEADVPLWVILLFIVVILFISYLSNSGRGVASRRGYSTGWGGSGGWCGGSSGSRGRGGYGGGGGRFGGGGASGGW